MVDNEYLDDILRRLQGSVFAFMDDIRRQTRIFEGRRSVEEQLSGEYHGRFLIELIQNADDACGKDGEILIVIRQNPSLKVIVFNTGKGFTSGNFESLCTLGLTDKNPEETIGNKGLGFRSVLEVCDRPIIFSSDPDRPEGASPCFDGYCFRFDPQELRNLFCGSLQSIASGGDIPTMEIAGRSFPLLETAQLEIADSLKNSLRDPNTLQQAIKTLPVYEMPLPCETYDPLLLWAASKGAATAVCLEIKQSARGIFQKAVAQFNEYTLLFLRNARRVSIYMHDADEKEPHCLVEFEINVPRLAKDSLITKGHVKAKYHDKESWSSACGTKPEKLRDESRYWWFYRKPISRTEFEAALEGLPERWQDISQVRVELAIPIATDDVPGRFAIYLPTLASTGTGVWINAPFYGKIDRTGIDWDRPWNSYLLKCAIACVADTVNVLRQSADMESAQGLLHLLGITDQGQKLAEAQISSDLIRRIVREEPWVLAEPDSKGRLNYIRLPDLTSAEDCRWGVNPVEPVMNIVCRERIPITFSHPQLAADIIKNTSRVYEVATKKPQKNELAQLAEIAIQRIDKDKRDSNWWNNLYRWLGSLDMSYDALVGRKLIWTQTGIYKAQKESRVFSPPGRLVASTEENSSKIRKFQEVLARSVPSALKDRVAFLHPEIDLNDKSIRSLLMEYSSGSIVREFRTNQVADFILNHICPELYRKKMSSKMKIYLAEVFAWTFILWNQMRGEGVSVDWSQLLVPTTLGWQPANETYAGKDWTGDSGSDLEHIFRSSQPLKPFLKPPAKLIRMFPKNFQKLVSEYDLGEDLRQFVIDVLRVWTAPRIIVLRASKASGPDPEFCTKGSYHGLNTFRFLEIPEKRELPIGRDIWQKYLQRMDEESKRRPLSKEAEYVLSEIACLEDIEISEVNAEALARCLGRGWSKYYSRHATTNIQRHRREGGERREWSVTGFIVEQLKNLNWIPMKVWATREEGGRLTSNEFNSNVGPQEVLKLKQAGRAPIYALLPHIAPSVEAEISEDLCGKIGIAIYSPQESDVGEPLHIMSLLHQAHSHLPSGREYYLLSLWQDMFDAATLQVADGNTLAGTPSSALGFEIQKDGRKRLCWLNPIEEGKTEKQVVWVNDIADSLTMLPPGSFVAYSGKRTTKLADRIRLLQRILCNVEIRKLSALNMIPEFDSVEGWSSPVPLSDAFPWLIQPALALLAFGRQTSQPMSVSNPSGEFRPLASQIQRTRVQYVRNLKIKLEGLDGQPVTCTTFYSSAENLLLLDIGAELRLRSLAAPLTRLFGKEDYLKPAELWLMKVEEATEDNRLREEVPLEIAVEKLEIEENSLRELIQAIGGKAQQIIRSVAPALYALMKRGRSPVSAHELNDVMSRTADSGNPYDVAEGTMASVLSKSGMAEAKKYSAMLRQIAERQRNPAEIAEKAYEHMRLDLGDWNSAAQELEAYAQIINNTKAIQDFNHRKQETRWAACGFLQIHLQGDRKEEFRKRWNSYDELKPCEAIHQTWIPASVQIDESIVRWFKEQAAELLVEFPFSNRDPSEIIVFITKTYGDVAKDPEKVLNDNFKALNLQWKHLRILLAILALRESDGDITIPLLKTVDDEAPGKWLMNDEKMQSLLSVVPETEEGLFVLLRRWLSIQAIPIAIKKKVEDARMKTIDELIKGKAITPEEEGVAKECLAKGAYYVPKQTVARKQLEIPEKGKPLDDLQKRLDELLNDNNQDILGRLAKQVDISVGTCLGDQPRPTNKRKLGGSKGGKFAKKDTDFIGYVGEYLVYSALKKRYPYIDLSNWVSGNKQIFFPGSRGNDSLGYDFCIPACDHRVLIEVKCHTGDQSFFEFGASEVDASQVAVENGDLYQVWIIRNLEDNLDIDRIPNPLDKKVRKHFRFEIGRVYYQTE